MKGLGLFVHYCLLSLFLFACSKKDRQPDIDQGVVGPRVVKVSTIDLSTGFGPTSVFAYDEKGRVKSEANDYATFVAGYNAAGRLSSITQTVNGGSPTVYGLTYNSSGKLVAKTVTETIGGITKTGTIKYEYNTAGQLIRIFEFDNLVSEISWDGDNISELRNITNGTLSATIKYTTYDNRVQPYYNIRNFLEAAHQVAQSKNNPLGMYSSLTGSSQFVYEYNANGTVSRAVNPSSGMQTLISYAP